MEVAELIQREGLKRGLRPETIKTYSYAVNKFLRTYHKQPHEITKEDIEAHLLQLIKWDRAGSTVNVYLHALRFFYENVLGKRLMVNIPSIKVRKRLPEFLTQEEMGGFLGVVSQTKHKLLLILTYGSGFRVSEVVNLKVRDLDFQAGYGWIREGKGGKERLFVIPEKLKRELEEWIASQKLGPEDWLFPGYRQSHYSESSVRKILEEARQSAGISKHITPHSLRHSFANHLLEQGYSLIEVKELLGHSRLETTMIYTHTAFPRLAKVKSPYDSLPEIREKEDKNEGREDNNKDKNINKFGS